MARATTVRSSSSRALVTALVSTVLVLNVVGLVMVMSASSVTAIDTYGSSWIFVKRHLAWTALGLLALAVVARLDYRALRRVSVPLAVLSLGLLVLVFVPGVGVRVSGASRWIGRGSLRFQPAELAKLALLLLVADLLARRAREVGDARRVLRPLLLVFVATAALVLRQPDMGTTLIIGLIVVTLLFAGGVPLRQLVPVGVVGASAALLLALSAAYRRDRVLSFLDPFADAANTGYQAVQSLIALGTGSLTGVGLGAGRAKWLFLPNAHTDFIFAVIGEELGLVGTLLVVALFGMFAVLGIRTAVRAPDRFGFLLALGATTWIVGQALVNISATVGLLPVTGVPLPFVSFGGSALLFTMAAAGVLVSVARRSGSAPARAVGR